MVPVKSFMVPKDKFITVERDVDVRTAGRVMRDRNIGTVYPLCNNHWRCQDCRQVFAVRVILPVIGV